MLGVLALALVAVPATRAQSPEPRVIGGSATTIDQYPWQAAVVYDPSRVSGNPFQRQFCGGSLITQYIVLTAGHCVHGTDPQNNSDLDPDDVNVVLGQTTLSSAPPSSEFNVQGVAKQDTYDDSYGPGGGVPSNDAGYLVLQSPYNATTPIDIAGSGEGALWDSASPEQITGWGATAESGPGSGGSNTLQHATVPIVTDASCAGSYGSHFNVSTMVCAGYTEGGVDTCYGDSGGPMQAPLAGGGYRLVGITSWGEGCAQPDAPGVYTRVAGDSLRPAVAAKVFELETTFGLPHENVIGDDGGGDTQPPAAPTITDTDPDSPSNLNDLKVKGSAEGGSTVRLYRAPAASDCTPGNLVDTDTAAVFSSPGLDASVSSNSTTTFRATATDAAGNTSGCSAPFQYIEDSTAPSDPTLSSSSHQINVASSDPTVDMSFSGASDGLSGVDGFSYVWSTSPATVPDTTKDAEQTATGTTSPVLADGNSHYFHLRTRDNAGNWTSTVHLGPFVIDTTQDTQPPSDPTLSSPSHTVGVASSDPTVDMSFSGASDGLSGVDGFSYQWSTSPTTLPDTTKDAEESATGTTSPVLADGNSHHFHLRTRDNAGNWTSTVHLGPFVIDTQADLGPPPVLIPLATTDGTPPRAQISARSSQSVGGEIILVMGCDEDCTARATGLVVAKPGAKLGLASARSARITSRFKLTTAEAVIAAGGSATLALEPRGKKVWGALRKLVRRGARAKAKLNVTFSDRAGNATFEGLVVPLQR